MCAPQSNRHLTYAHIASCLPWQKSDEQKLIYSGKLLRDSAVLKDILRQYDGQDTHTVHLVFTPKSQRLDPKANISMPSSSSSAASSSASNGASASSSGSTAADFAAAATASAQNVANELR